MNRQPSVSSAGLGNGLLLAGLFFLAGSAIAQDEQQGRLGQQQQEQQAQGEQRQAEGAQLSRADEDPFAVPDETFISLSGTVEGVVRDAFTLDFGGGVITVEMDDGDRDADGYLLMPGDAVTVYGLIDDDFFEAKTIEASSVYLEDLGTYFYASAVDEEDRGFVMVTTPVDADAVVMQGTVTDVDDDEFTLDTGRRSITVEVEQMPYNPLDDDGYQRIDVGDVVNVSGSIDNDFLEGRELVAESVITIHDFD